MPEPALTPANERSKLTIPRAMHSPNQCKDYAWRILHTRPLSLVGYWPLDEVDGSVAHDLSGHAANGAYTGVDLAKHGAGDGRVCPYFDGANDGASIYSANLVAAFNSAEGTIMAWARVTSAATWADGANRRIVNIRGLDGSNQIWLAKTNVANQLMLARIVTTQNPTITLSAITTAWFCLALTWSVTRNLITGYLNGRLLESQTGAATWDGPLTSTHCCIGQLSTTHGLPWAGYIAHCALWSCALSSPELETLGRID